MNQYLFTFFCAIVCIQSACKEKISKDQTYSIIISQVNPSNFLQFKFVIGRVRFLRHALRCPMGFGGAARDVVGLMSTKTHDRSWTVGSFTSFRRVHGWTVSCSSDQSRSWAICSHWDETCDTTGYDWWHISNHDLKLTCAVWSTCLDILFNMNVHIHIIIATLWCKTLLLEPRYVVIVQFWGPLS